MPCTAGIFTEPCTNTCSAPGAADGGVVVEGSVTTGAAVDTVGADVDATTDSEEAGTEEDVDTAAEGRDASLAHPATNADTATMAVLSTTTERTISR